jgi:hypothetical protein
MEQYIKDVRAQVPGIAHLPDSMIAYQSIDSLCRMAREEKTAEGKASNKIEVRAHQNLTRIDVPAGADNRRDMNHPGRVLPGTVASLQQQWHNARREWGPDGVETLIGYDVMSIGHAGCITLKGWDALHHPGSYEVSLKYFTIANVARAAKGMKALNAVDEDGFVISDSWHELADIAEIKTAMSNLVTAAHLAVPWNFSYKTIEAFLRTTSYMDAELAGLKKAPIVAAFIDHLLHVNAGYWLSDTNFLDLPAIAEQWRSWWCGQRAGWRPEASGGQNSGQHKQGGQQQGSGGKGGANSKKKERGSRGQGAGQSGQQGGGSGQGGSGGQQRAGGKADKVLIINPLNEKNLCRKYNEGNSCPNAHGSCSFTGKFGGMVKLYHMCDYKHKDGPHKDELCMAKHVRTENHK